MENVKCKVILDSPTSTYRSGDTINGTLSLICLKGKKIRGIYCQITGYGKVGWSKMLHRSSQTPTPNTPPINQTPANKPERSINYSGNEEYLNQTFYLAGCKNGPGYEIPTGTNTYPFAFTLKHLLPSSFKGTYGKIKYKMEFIVDKPWQFDEKYEVPLIIYKSFDLNYDPYAGIPQQKQITRNIGIFNGGPISLHISIPRSGCIPGQHLPLQVIVSNNSSAHVEKVKFCLLKIVDYNSITPTRVTRQEILKIMKKEAGGVEKKSEQKYEHTLEIPELPSTDTAASTLIHIHYEIQVEAKINGLYKNLIEKLPLTIATIPLREDDGNAGGGAPNLVQMPMPMPVVYPSLPPFSNCPTSTPPTLPPNAMSSSLISAGSIGSTGSEFSTPPLPYNPDFTMPPNAQQSSPYPPPRNNRNHSAVGSTSAGDNSLHGSGNLATAPPLDFHSYAGSPNSTRSSVCSNQHWDTPPTYDEVFGSPAHSLISNSSTITATNNTTNNRLLSSSTNHLQQNEQEIGRKYDQIPN